MLVTLGWIDGRGPERQRARLRLLRSVINGPTESSREVFQYDDVNWTLTTS